MQKCTYCSCSLIFTSSILTGAHAHSLGFPKNSPMLSGGDHEVNFPSSSKGKWDILQSQLMLVNV